MAQAEYMIGTTLEGMTNIEELTTPLPPPVPEYDDCAVETELASGLVRGSGLPRARWVFPWLFNAQRDQLKAFCSGKSARVYIQTIKLGSDVDYAIYQAVMVWRKGMEDLSEATIVQNITIEFLHMVEIEVGV